MILHRRPPGPPPRRGAPQGDSVDAILSTLFVIWGILFTVGCIGLGILLIKNPTPGDWGIGGLFGLAGIMAAPFGTVIAILFGPRMLKGDRGAYRLGGWLCLAPILLHVPAVPILFAYPHPELFALAVTLTSLWLALAISLICRSITAPASASSGPRPSAPPASAAAVPLSGPGPHDPSLGLAFRVFAWLAAASLAFAFLQTLAPLPAGMTQSFVLGLTVTYGVGALVALIASFTLPPGIARGDLRVIRPLAIVLMIPAIPSALGLVFSLLSPLALLTMVFSVPGLVQIAWIAMTGLLLVRGFSTRLN
jgi:hypothetical protein